MAGGGVAAAGRSPIQHLEEKKKPRSHISLLLGFIPPPPAPLWPKTSGDQEFSVLLGTAICSCFVLLVCDEE